MFEGLFQPMHLLVIFGIALLVFGPKKLPELGKGIGEGIRGFKSAMKADEEKPASTTTTIASDHRAHQGVNCEFRNGNPVHAHARTRGAGTQAAALNAGTRSPG